MNFDGKKKDILIYNDNGVGTECLKNTECFFRQYVDCSIYKVRYINAEQIIKNDWIQTAALLVIPGGADIPYFEKLRGQGCTNISEYVKNGGKYLGICAGAYFACGEIEFALGTDEEVRQERELKFFNEVGFGPVFGQYSYSNNSGVHAVNVKFGEQVANVYYNGGCTFRGQVENVEIIGTFVDKENLPAIIKCKVGAGIALLSGVHFEFSTNKACNYNNDPRMQKIAAKIDGAACCNETLKLRVVDSLGLVPSRILLEAIHI
jgi:biotin--protein ligase